MRDEDFRNFDANYPIASFLLRLVAWGLILLATTALIGGAIVFAVMQMCSR